MLMLECRIEDHKKARQWFLPWNSGWNDDLKFVSPAVNKTTAFDPEEQVEQSWASIAEGVEISAPDTTQWELTY